MSSQSKKIIKHTGDSCIRASAGTGKTSLLVEKFVHLLKTKDDDGNFREVKNILAITFTDKAADEMKSRIASKILKEANRLYKNIENKESIKTAKHLRKSRRRMSQSYVSTIHSFCARVLRENPVEAGIDPHFEIMDAERSSHLQSVFLERFLLSRLRSRDQLVLDLAYRYRFDSDFKMESSIKKMVNGILPLIRASGLKKAELTATYKKELKNISGRLESCQRAINETLLEMEQFANTDARKKKLEGLKKGLPMLDPKKDIYSEKNLKNLICLERFAKGWRFKADDEKKKEIEERLKENVILYRMLVVSSLAEKSAKQFAELMESFHNYMELNVKRRARLDFDDLQEKTLELFRRSDSVREHYKNLFHHVLVDEFQDVNGIQRDLLCQLAPPGSGRLFVVGDAKQAIYGFRGGDIEVFRDVENKIKNCDGGKVFDLTINYRSNSRLVEFANTFFKENHSEIFAEHDACLPERGSSALPPMEHIKPAEADASADEARHREAGMIASRIREMVERERMEIDDNGVRRPVRYHDIAILFRKFTSLAVYEASLMNGDIPYLIHKGNGFYRSQEIADLLSVLSFIDCPGDIVSWIAILRSPYAGCSDETVLKLRRTPLGKTIEPLAYLKSSSLPTDIVDAVERDKFLLFIEWAKELIELKDRMTVSEIIETVFERSSITGILGAQSNGLQKVANVLKLIEMARMMEKDHTVTLKNFVRRMMKSYDSEEGEAFAAVALEDDDAVKIMTVHQSKGLEFPVVFLVDIDSMTQWSGLGLLFNPSMGLAVKYVEEGSLKTYEGNVYDEIKKANKEKEEKGDSARLFYVACTRARERLILSGGKAGKKNGLAEKISIVKALHPDFFYLPSVAQTAAVAERVGRSAYDAVCSSPLSRKVSVDKPVKDGKTDKPPAGMKLTFSAGSLVAYAGCRRLYLLERLYRVGMPPEMPETKFNAAETGEAVHAVIERLDFGFNKKDFLRFVANCVKDKFPRRHNALSKTVAGELGSLYGVGLFEKLRSGELTDSGREVPFKSVLKTNGMLSIVSGKVDMLLRDAKGFPFIVDFKYSAYDGRLKERNRFQLELYALFTAKGFGVDAVTCALVYIKGKKPKIVEWKLGKEELEKVEKKAGEALAGIVKLEEDARRYYMGAGLFDRFKGDSCPDSRCRFKTFCI